MHELQNKVDNMLARGRVLLANAAAKLQSLQVALLADEMKDDMEHLEPFGFTSCPEAGAEALAAFLGGDRSHGVVVVVSDRRFRVAGLKPGEVAIYNADGAKVTLKRGKIVEVECDAYIVKTKTYHVTAPDGATFDTPMLASSGDVADQGGASTMSGMRGVFNDHDHPETDTTTGKPNQVMR